LAEAEDLPFVGRAQELEALRRAADRAQAGHGAVVFIAGEAGVGKSRLAREAAARAAAQGFTRMEARCLPEAPAPYLPIYQALQTGGLSHLLSTERSPRLEYLYLASPLGMTMASAAREESPFDRDLFLSMLSAVESFVTDSLSALTAGDAAGGGPQRRLNALGFGEFRILILPAGFGNLVAILRGSEGADLVAALEQAIEELGAQFGPRLAAWDGDRSVRDEFSGPLRKVLDSKRFEGDTADLTPSELKYRTLETLARGVAKAAEARPIVLFLDDLHLADSATIFALQYLGRSISDVRMLILATFRAEEVLPAATGSPLAPARAALLEEEVATEIVLGPLDSRGVKLLAEEQLGVVDLDAPFVEAIYRESHGTPFMVIELLRFLVQEGRLETVGGTVQLKGGMAGARLPSHLREAVHRRVSRLPRADRDVLECAAVDGNVFSPSRVACALELRRLDVLRALRNLQEDHGLVRLQGETASFDHTKVHEVVYEGVHADLRAEYHAAIARCCVKQMEADGKDLTVVAAHHFAKARDPEGLTHILHAAERASVASSHAEAADWYEAYLQLAGEQSTAGVLAAYGTALLYAGRYEKAERTFARLLEMPTGEMERLTYVRAMAEAVANQRGYSAALTLMNRNIPHEGGLTWARFAVARARFALRLGDLLRVETEIGKAVPIMEAEGGAVDRAEAYGVLAAIGGDTGDYDKAVTYGRKALEAVGEGAPAAPEFLNLIGAGLLYRGKFEEAGEVLRRGLAAAEARSDPFRLAALSTNLGLLEIRRGDPKGARAHLLDALRWAERLGTAQLVGRSLAMLGLAAAEDGRDTDAAEFFQRALPVADRGEDRGAMVLLRIYLAQFELERGDPDLARKHGEDAYALAAEAGDAPEQAFARAVVAGAVGVAGDAATAAKMFDDASRGLRFSPSQYEYAEVMRMWGDYLIDCAEEEQAREKLEAARQVFAEMGATGRARRVAARLDLLPKAQ
jgi:tetratricopeptide (TPR) repeat protein